MQNYDENPEGVTVVGTAAAITAYARMKYNTSLPVALTETNWGFHNLSSWLNHAVHTRRRSLPIARQILSMAKHPDKCLLRHMHDMSADAGGLFTFRSDPPNPTVSADTRSFLRSLLTLLSFRCECDQSDKNAPPSRCSCTNC